VTQENRRPLEHATKKMRMFKFVFRG
jgi:hypothetical protein